ncbi:MAG: signal peptidase II [Metallibacterium sp.]
MKIVTVIAVVFLLFELGTRWLARLIIPLGDTISLFGNFYLTNVLNPNRVMAFGIGAIAWLLVAQVVAMFFFIGYVFAGRHIYELTYIKMYWLGLVAASLLNAVVLSNLFEASVLGGVTDYFAIIDLKSKTAHIINLGDIALGFGLIALLVSTVGMPIALMIKSPHV